MKLFVEGWRFISQSYAIVNQFHLLELLKRSHVELYHREMPYLRDWQDTSGLLDPQDEAALRAIPDIPSHLPAGDRADALLRMEMPFNLLPSPIADRTYVFGLTEHGIVQREMLDLMGVPDLRQVHAATDSVIITSSEWSRQGFIGSGAEPSRVKVVPIGVDPRVCYPLARGERQRLRQRLGIDDYFVFLNVSAMSDRKGIRPLLKAFAQVVDRHPEARLILKGTSSLYHSQHCVVSAWREVLTPDEQARVLPRLSYVGKDLSFTEVAQLMQAADVYVSSYLAEGFNMPVLEAIACGTPVLCTAGGPTDDFTRPEFARRIHSTLEAPFIRVEKRLMLRPDIEHLVSLMEEAITDQTWRSQARQAGPAFVAQGYTWSRVVDQLLAVLDPTLDPTLNPSPVSRSTPEPTTPDRAVLELVTKKKTLTHPLSPSAIPVPPEDSAPISATSTHSAPAQGILQSTRVKPTITKPIAIKPTLIVEGWRSVPSSFAILNQYQLLELVDRPDLNLFYRPLPYIANWQELPSVLSPEAEARLDRIPHAQPGQAADAVLRVAVPYNLQASEATRTAAIAMVEYDRLTDSLLKLMGVRDLGEAMQGSDTLLITPTQWAKQGLINSGADPNRIELVSLGVDPTTFQPIASDGRSQLRQRFGWERAFIFLNVSTAIPRKGLLPLVRCFLQVAALHPQAKLVIKGNDSLYVSQRHMANICQQVASEPIAQRAAPRVAYWDGLTDWRSAIGDANIFYIGQHFSEAQLAELFQAADVYVSPYLAEGFNMPVLEAIACGLPVICTAGGSTDDFTRPEFARRIRSTPARLWVEAERQELGVLLPDETHLLALMVQAIGDRGWREGARRAGTQFVRSGYTWGQVVDRLLGVLLEGF